MPFAAFQEGRALYAERLAYEQGFEKDPLDNLGQISSEMMRSARLVHDGGIHYMRWTRDHAVIDMIDNVGMTDEEAGPEVERCVVDPGQALAYAVGMLKILALREHAQQALGPQFDLKQFHNVGQAHAALPLAVLEQTIEQWIEPMKQRN